MRADGFSRVVPAMIDGEQTELRGAKILIVEDEALVSMLLEDILQDLGCDRVGPAFSLKQALAIAESEPVLDAAILDVNLRGTPIYPVAAVLARRGVPFVFATGYGREGLEEGWRDRPNLQKPFTVNDVETALLAALATRHPPAST